MLNLIGWTRGRPAEGDFEKWLSWYAAHRERTQGEAMRTYRQRTEAKLENMHRLRAERLAREAARAAKR